MSKPKTKSLPVCTCGHICRFYRSAVGSATEWRCTYCERTYSKTEALSLYPAIAVEEPTFTTDSAPILTIFGNHPYGPAPAPVTGVALVPITLPVIEPAIEQHKEQVVPNEILYPDLLDNGVATAAILEEAIEDIKVSEPLANNQNLEDIRECVDIDQLFLFGKYRPEEKRTSPTRMQMPTMAATAQPAESPVFDTGRNTYSLRSER